MENRVSRAPAWVPWGAGPGPGLVGDRGDMWGIGDIGEDSREGSEDMEI